MMEEHLRARRKRGEEKIHFSGKGWNNTIILSEPGGEHKENSGKIQQKNRPMI